MGTRRFIAAYAIPELLPAVAREGNKLNANSDTPAIAFYSIRYCCCKKLYKIGA